MRAKSMALILVALACGLVATIGVSQVMKENAQSDAVPLGPIVVTMSNMNIGQAVTEELVKVEQWPQDRIPVGAIASLEEIEGKYARQYMFPGEPLLSGKLMDQNSDHDAAKIPEGFRVAAVKVNEESAVANLINPGDHVDVIAFLKSRNSGDSVRSKTILKDIRVFAVNSETSRAQEMSEDGPIDAKTVSLLVKPKQVQMLVLAEQLGKLELSLRHPDEADDDLDESTTVEDLLGDSGNGGSDKPIGGGSWLSLLRPTNSEPTLMEPGSAPDPDEPFQMVVMGPDQIVKWVWEDENELPEMVKEEGQESATSALDAGRGGEGAELAPAGTVPMPVPPAPESPFVGDV